MLLFWLAHVYADAVAWRLEHADPLTWREVWNIAKYEWPMLQAAVPALLALSLGWAGALPTLTAVRLPHRARSGSATHVGLCHRPRLAAVCARDAGIGRPQWRIRVGHCRSQAPRPIEGTIGERLRRKPYATGRRRMRHPGRGIRAGWGAVRVSQWLRLRVCFESSARGRSRRALASPRKLCTRDHPAPCGPGALRARPPGGVDAPRFADGSAP